jgi:hypothetical protein
MRLVILLGLALAAVPYTLNGQSVDQQIAAALLAAPANLKDEAAVITFDSNGEIEVIREGSNGLMCWDSSNEPGRQGNWTSQCTSELNRARVQQNHQFSHRGSTPEEIQALFDEAEADGSREVPTYGTMYYHWRGDAETGGPHTNIAVPFATEDLSGIPEGRRNDAMWIMGAGTSGAHLMIPGF